jgi:hypothetical protein
MLRDVEISMIDLRFEGHRLRDRAQEAKLLVSIRERGVERPLQGILAGGTPVLLDGFKRYRCAKVLSIGSLPFSPLGEDCVSGIVAMVRESNEKGLTLLEQARFVTELHHIQGMAIPEIAAALSRSPSWVAMRLDLVGEMSETVRKKVFAGSFPAYSYMYTLRTFLRKKGVRKSDGDAFISAVSGKHLSIREIEQLAHGYFRGPEWFRREIDGGHLSLVLSRMREAPRDPDAADDFERGFLKDLETLSKSMLRVTEKSLVERESTPVFRVQASLLVSGILSRFGAVRKALEVLHDRTGAA